MDTITIKTTDRDYDKHENEGEEIEMEINCPGVYKMMITANLEQ